MVSIGPYYHGGGALRGMEEYKRRYMKDLLSRFSGDADGNADDTAESTLLKKMRGLQARALACYSECPVPPPPPVGKADDFFAEMLLMDGCFILEFFFKWHEKNSDTLSAVTWVRTLVLYDLLLIENQIPFFVLEALYGAIAGEQGNRQLLLNLLVEYIEAEIKPSSEPSAGMKVNHLLHLYYGCFVPKTAKDGVVVITIPWPPNPKDAPEPKTRTIPRATELLEAGVTFVRCEVAPDRFDVTFDRRTGVMKIPTIEIDDMKLPLLINLIAFEQTLCGEKPRLLTSYVALMSKLIVTARDVELLRRHRIVESLLADDEEAAQFFSRLGNVGTMDYERQAFFDLYKDVRHYCDSSWHRYRATLHRDYFSNPWSAISVVVAAFLVALTIAQTYFAVYPSKN
ncbi:UPF0481 protein At3g47200-like [Oryza brachyantha]|uniref:UPF0481 protein At3g47200-like n=1 Tax=Oryza brachyantha TaxID=4533 RepID=UPI001ADD5732|nr:UPF0481 protein At3g47200-like [Oryza brachyantha]